MQTALYAASLLLTATNFLFAASPIDQRLACESLITRETSLPAQTNKTLQLESLGIEIDIPENFRAIGRTSGAVEVISTGNYDYLQCMIENEVPTSTDEISVILALTEPTSEALIRSRSNERFGTKFIGEEVIAGQPAFIYTSGGMMTSLIVHITYPGEEKGLAISTEIGDDNTVYMEETLERILSTLSFL